MPWQSADLDFALGAQRNQCSAFTHFTDEDGRPLENEDESGKRLCEYWRTISETRNEGERHHHCWVIGRNKFDVLMATMKESAPGPDGTPNGLYRSPGSFLCSRTLGCPVFSVASCEVFTATTSHMWNSREEQILMARGVRQGCPASGFLFAKAFDPIFENRGRVHSQEPCWPGLSSTGSVRVC